MPENWQHVAGSQKWKKKKQKNFSYCQLTVVTEWKDRIMCKESFGGWWWKDTIKICFSNVGLNIWECWDFQFMQKFSMELVNWSFWKKAFIKESLSHLLRVIDGEVYSKRSIGNRDKRFSENSLSCKTIKIIQDL